MPLVINSLRDGHTHTHTHTHTDVHTEIILRNQARTGPAAGQLAWFKSQCSAWSPMLKVIYNKPSLSFKNTHNEEYT